VPIVLRSWASESTAANATDQSPGQAPSPAHRVHYVELLRVAVVLDGEVCVHRSQYTQYVLPQYHSSSRSNVSSPVDYVRHCRE